jgi:hypothetical protein
VTECDDYPMFGAGSLVQACVARSRNDFEAVALTGDWFIKLPILIHELFFSDTLSIIIDNFFDNILYRSRTVLHAGLKNV